MEYPEERPVVGLEKFAKNFCFDRIMELNQLKQALDHDDFESIQKVSHKWKGFCSPYGFSKLCELSITLEEVAKLKDKKNSEAIIKQMDNYLNFKASNLTKIQ